MGSGTKDDSYYLMVNELQKLWDADTITRIHKDGFNIDTDTTKELTAQQAIDYGIIDKVVNK